jgi:hypothetical protein
MITVGLKLEEGVPVVETPLAWFSAGRGVFGLIAEFGVEFLFVDFGGGESDGVG